MFHVRLPVAAVQHAPHPVQVAEQEEFILNGRILLVDDEEPVLEFEREVLSGAGASIVALTRGDHAIPLLERQSFDVLVFDGKMPGRYNGVDICDWLAKHRPELLDRVILTVSNVEDAELRSRIQGLGVRSLSKPFQVGDLLSACRAILQKPRSAAAHA